MATAIVAARRHRLQTLSTDSDLVLELEDALLMIEERLLYLLQASRPGDSVEPEVWGYLFGLLAAPPLTAAQTSPSAPLGVEPPGTPPDIVAVREVYHNEQTMEVQVVKALTSAPPLSLIPRPPLSLLRASIYR